ncbi:ABC transporter substrate-binding protein [Pseudomonas sp. NPDC007930]|uniref:ABC transporter substrate-binding protein n=1 Tax=Pseudomonas sp. NPDC007930 TaxID=3364417 RepID=UPI0036DFA8A5
MKRHALLALLAWPLWAQALQVTDDLGQAVELPAPAQRIAEGWYAHQVLLLTLGAGGRIVATVNHAHDHPWMFRVQPAQRQALQVEGRTFNVEQLLAQRVDLAFLSGNDRQGPALQQAGIAVMHMGFDDFAGLQRSLLATAHALGDGPALARAEAYNAWLAQTLGEVRQRLGPLTPAQRPRVLHLASLEPLKADGDGTLVEQWIQLAGGRNAAEGLHGNLQAVSAEQVLAWNPDVIIVAAQASNALGKPGFAWLKLTGAGQAGKLLRNPEGVFPWERYGTEVGLQVPWAAQQLHPARFAGQNMAALAQGFYQRFFDYPLTAEQAESLLTPAGFRR